MSYRSTRRGILGGCLAFLLAAAFPQMTRGSDELAAGFDLFDPVAGSRIFVDGLGLIPVVGVPLHTFPDFGSVDLGSTDSILQRRDRLFDGSPLSRHTDIEMLAMQLMSTDGSNLFFSLRPDPSSGGMDISPFGPEPHKTSTFTWDLTLHLEIQPLNQMLDVPLTVASTHWSHLPQPGTLLIPGVNFELDGPGDQSADFFPACFVATGPSGTSLIFRPSGVVACPEPAAFILIAIGLAGMAFAARRRVRAPATSR